jgi:excisionase family DNA binding protein
MSSVARRRSGANGQPDDLVTAAEAAHLLTVSKHTIRKYVLAGILKSKRLPFGQLRFRRKDVLALLVSA